MTNLTSIPPSLLDDLLRGNGVPFLGATTEAQKLATRLQVASGQSVADGAGGAGAAGGAMARLPDVAQQFELAQNRHALVSQVRDWLATNAAQPTAIHHLLAQLPFATYFTTAYHDLLEQALTTAGRRFVRVVRQEDTAQSDASTITVVKLLGDISQPASLVLTEKDYLTFLDRSPLLADVVRSTLATRALLFLDYDLADAELRRLFFQVVRWQSVQKRSAFAVWPQPDENQRRFWAAENLQFIAEEPVAFLQGLHREMARRAPPAQPSPVPTVIAPLSRRPFRFLDAYDAANADLFAGRDQEIKLLSQKVLAHRLVVLTGASGTGKTSLVQAGVGPRLTAEGWATLVIRPFGDPSATPLAVMIRALAPLAGDLPADAALVDHLRRAEAATKERLVLVLDQFEELFIRLGPDALAAFISQLAPCLNEGDLDTRFVLSLRDDYFLRLGSLENQLSDIFHNVFILQRLRRDQAIAAVVEPLRRLGIEIEEGLAPRIASDLDKEGVDPPQLQIVCDRLYDDMLAQGRQRIDLADYERLGGIAELLSAYLSDVLARLPQGRLVLETLVGDGGLRAARSLAEIQGRVKDAVPDLPAVIEALIEARLVRGISSKETLHYELVHDVLAAEIWKWLSEGAREAERARGILARGLSDWQTSQTLLDAPRLDFVATRWLFLNTVAGDTQALLLRSALTLGHDMARWQERIPDLTLHRQLLVELAGHADARVRARVMSSFAQLPGVSSTDEQIMTLIRQSVIADADASVRRSAAFSLTQVQTDAGLRFLAEQAQITDVAIRSRAIEALAAVGDAHIRIWPVLTGKVRRQTAAAIARLRLARHRQQWLRRTGGAAVGGAIGFWVAFFVEALLIEHSPLAAAMFNGMFASFFGALAGAITGLGVALAAALADGDHRLARASGGALGGAVGLALGLEVYWLVHLTDRFVTFAWVGLVAGVCIGVGLGLAPTRARWSWVQPVAGAGAGALGFLAAYPFLVAYADFIASLSIRSIFDLTLWKALLMGAVIGGMIGAGLVWADRRFTAPRS